MPSDFAYVIARSRPLSSGVLFASGATVEDVSDGWYQVATNSASVELVARRAESEALVAGLSHSLYHQEVRSALLYQLAGNRLAWATLESRSSANTLVRTSDSVRRVRACGFGSISR